MKSQRVRRKRLATGARVICCVAVIAIVLFFASLRDPSPRSTTNAPVPTSDCTANETFHIECSTAHYGNSEQSRLLNTGLHRDNLPRALEQISDLSKLEDTPAISGGLYTDRQDLDKPRDGEKYVTFAEYLDCLGRNLRVDYHKQREEELTDAEVQQSFPYVVSMATVELGDIKALMCNINVPIRHMMYVINSDVTSVTNFFHDVEKAFNFTQRLRIHWPGYNMGFAGSVNFAMRDAMRYSFDEVPFFFILNNDIRFPEETLPRSLPEFRKVTRQDKAMLEGLRAEVAKEPSEYTPANRRRPLQRSSDNSTLLVTSTALPDRIRYMPYEERKKIFEKFYGGLFFDDGGDPAAFGMSRLAIETVGFMDENFYPAYYEDTDWRYRQFRLGLSDFFVKDVPFKKHFVNAMIKKSNSYDAHPNEATEVEKFAKSVVHFVAVVINEYTLNKKFGLNSNGKRDPYPSCHELPLDAWVMDVPRRKALIEAHIASYEFFRQDGPSKEGKNTLRVLGWLPAEERIRIVSAFPGDRLADVVMRAFKDCSLVRHDTQ